jgi:hypothetical protein
MDTVTEAGKKSARIEFLDTTNSQKLLPPEGNTDLANRDYSGARFLPAKHAKPLLETSLFSQGSFAYLARLAGTRPEQLRLIFACHR